MATALTTYGTTTAATTISSANTLVTGLGASATNKNTQLGMSTGFGQIVAHGTASAWPALGSIGAPDGKGFLLDSSLLQGQQILAGNWTPTLRLNVSFVSVVADLYVRAYVRNISGVYTQIGSNMVLSGQTITTSTANYTFSATNQPAQTFSASTSDQLYWDVWANVTTNITANSGAVLKLFEASSSSQGTNTLQLVTPGYQTAPSTNIITRRRQGNAPIYVGFQG